MNEDTPASGVKRSVNLVELIKSKGVSLKKVGKTFVGLCPFHKEKKPSFTVDPIKSLWHYSAVIEAAMSSPSCRNWRASLLPRPWPRSPGATAAAARNLLLCLNHHLPHVPQAPRRSSPASSTFTTAPSSKINEAWNTFATEETFIRRRSMRLSGSALQTAPS